MERDRAGRVDLVMIGSSTGGPNALATLWAQLPKDLPVPVIITQHMPPMFTTLFAERLTQVGTIPVTEGVDGAALQAGHAVLAPGDHHLVLDPNTPDRTGPDHPGTRRSTRAGQRSTRCSRAP